MAKSVKSVNKPMKEYSEQPPVEVEAKQPPVQEPEEVNTKEGINTSVPESTEEPRRLVLSRGPGNLHKIKWNRGGGVVPKACSGMWNDKRQAKASIEGAHAQIDLEKSKESV